MARAGLSKDLVVDAAIRIANRDGTGAVTLARVASDLEVRTPSLYNHIGGLGDLRREIALRTIHELGDVLAHAAVGLARDDALRSIAGAYRQFAFDHRGTYGATLAAPDPADSEHLAAASKAIEVIVTVLAGYGISGDEAIHATRSLRSAMHGFSSLELDGGFGIDLDPDQSHEWMIELLLGGISRLTA